MLVVVEAWRAGLLAELWDFHPPPFGRGHLLEKLLDVFFADSLARFGERLQVVHQVGLHRVVALDGLHLLDTVHLRQSLHPLLILRATCKTKVKYLD